MRQFRDAVSTEQFDLANAALHAARVLTYPNLNVQSYLDRIDAIASNAGLFEPGVVPGLAEAEMLVTYLFEQLGYHGNKLDYSDPENSYLNAVIDRKSGIPITLSILFVSVAKRLGLQAYGVGMPGHFLALVLDGDERAYFDCFNGVRLTEEDCVRLVKETTGYGGVFLPQWLEPADSADILLRVLNNLRIGHMQNERWDDALACLDLIDIVKPNLDFVMRDKALIAFGRKQFYQAAGLLDEYAERYPQAQDIPALRNSLRESMRRWARQN